MRYISDWNSVSGQACQSIKLCAYSSKRDKEYIIDHLCSLPDNAPDPYVLRVVCGLQLVYFRYLVQWVDDAGLITGYRVDWWSMLKLTDNSSVGLTCFRPLGLLDLAYLNDS